MKKNRWIILAATATVFLLGLMSIFLFAINTAWSRENQGVIGQVFVDGNGNGSLDAWDYRPENGLKMVINKFNESARSYTWFEEVEVINGEYRIDLPEGTYSIGVLSTSSGIYDLRYNLTFVANVGDTIVKKGEVSLGPTILLNPKNTMPGMGKG